MNSDDIHGPRIMAFVSPMCYEVDTLEDFEFLEFQIREMGSPLLEFLKTNFPGGMICLAGDLI